MRHLPIEAHIERRLLINYRIDPDVARHLLPAPFRPQSAGGFAIGGVCLIRLSDLRMKGLPRVAGWKSESAAHRFAVEWDGPDGVSSGVYIPRRDSNSRLNVGIGAGILRGEYHLARFDVEEDEGNFSVDVLSKDREIRAHIRTRLAGGFTSESVFDSLESASRFFEDGCVGFSGTLGHRSYDALHIDIPDWKVEPIDIVEIASSYFDDPDRFPRGSISIDSGLIMRDLRVAWRPLASMKPPVLATT